MNEPANEPAPGDCRARARNRGSLRTLGAAAALAAAALAAPPGRAADAGAKEGAALRSAFPEAERFTSRDLLLGDDLAARIEKLSRARVRERLVTFYTAWKGEAVAGYAVIHSHVVRTKRETFTLAFEPDGRIRRITILAFLEPEEYRPGERWLRQFQGKGAGDRLAVGDDIAPITGATLTARGIAERSRWLLQALKVAVGPEAAP
ncbi:MAG TPA: FMN-binding protein [Anaeromyxobacteraceae bacterium]